MSNLALNKEISKTEIIDNLILVLPHDWVLQEPHFISASLGLIRILILKLNQDHLRLLKGLMFSINQIKNSITSLQDLWDILFISNSLFSIDENL